MTTHSQRALILYRRWRFINHLLTYLLTYLHSSNEPGELSQWLCHDDSTINIVLDIIIIIINENY